MFSLLAGNSSDDASPLHHISCSFSLPLSLFLPLSNDVFTYMSNAGHNCASTIQVHVPLMKVITRGCSSSASLMENT